MDDVARLRKLVRNIRDIPKCGNCKKLIRPERYKFGKNWCRCLTGESERRTDV